MDKTIFERVGDLTIGKHTTEPTRTTRILHDRETHGRYNTRPQCNISPMNIVNIKKGSHTYSKQLVEKLGRGLELSGDEMVGFLGAAGVLRTGEFPQLNK